MGRRSSLTTSRPATLVVSASGAFAPPTVSDTKRKLLEGYKKPMPAIYSGVVQELIVLQHFARYSKLYKYDEVHGLGVYSIFEQVLGGLPEGEQQQVFNAYTIALDEDPEKYRSDAERLEAWAKSLSSATEIKPDAEGDAVQKALADIASRAAAGQFQYTKFFAVGLFKLLEQAGAKDPKVLADLTKSLNVSLEAVNRDLKLYKGILSKLSAAKELMAEVMEREKKKQAEREAAKAAQAAQSEETPAEQPASA